MGDFLSLTGAVFTVIVVLVLAYWCSRLLGRSWNRTSSGRSLKVIDQLQIGNDRQLVLIRVQAQVFLVGVSAAGIELLAELSKDFDETAIPQEESQEIHFLDILKTRAEELVKTRAEDLLQHKKRGDK